MHHHKFFRWFLVIYAITLIYHAFQLPFVNPLVTIGILAGLLLAIISHSYHGRIAFFLLLIHMSIDMVNHALYYQSYGIKEYVLGLFHLGLDLTFLYEESIEHFKNPKMKMLLVLAGLISIFLISKLSGLSISENTHEPIEALAMSGILGCVFYHFYTIRKKVK